MSKIGIICYNSFIREIVFKKTTKGAEINGCYCNVLVIGNNYAISINSTKEAGICGSSIRAARRYVVVQFSNYVFYRTWSFFNFLDDVLRKSYWCSCCLDHVHYRFGGRKTCYTTGKLI